MAHVKKAIIMVAGWGTRRLPVTKTIEKCMIPVGNRPVVDYTVQDCIKAGINEIIFVVGEQSDQIQSYYRSNIPLNDYLARNGKSEMIDLVRPLSGVKLHFVVQPGTGKYGTAVPVALAEQYINEGESVLITGGDDFIYNADGSSEIARLIEATPDDASGIIGVHVPAGDKYIPRYGFIHTDSEDKLIKLIEHPNPEPEHFIKNVSKYVFNHRMLTAVVSYVNTMPPAGKEYGIFDPFEFEIQNGEVMKVNTSVGQYLDAGTVESWLYAAK